MKLGPVLGELDGVVEELLLLGWSKEKILAEVAASVDSALDAPSRNAASDA